MRIALAQVSSVTCPQQNLEIIETAAKQAAGEGAQLVLFPEGTMRSFGYLDAEPALSEAAENVDGPWARAVKDIATAVGITIGLGMFTKGSPGPNGEERIKNTFLVTNADIDVRYDKIHLYDAYNFKESDSIEAGTKPVTFELGGIKFGLATCFDIRIPELFKHYGRAGVSAILVGASWAGGAGKVSHWQTLTAARALDSTCFIVACDQADPSESGLEKVDGQPTGVGLSTVVAPDGIAVATAGLAPEVLTVDLDFSAVEEMQKRLPVLNASVL